MSSSAINAMHTGQIGDNASTANFAGYFFRRFPISPS